jgi:hypothetical protein
LTYERLPRSSRAGGRGCHPLSRDGQRSGHQIVMKPFVTSFLLAVYSSVALLNLLWFAQEWKPIELFAGMCCAWSFFMRVMTEFGRDK